MSHSKPEREKWLGDVVRAIAYALGLIHESGRFVQPQCYVSVLRTEQTPSGQTNPKRQHLYCRVGVKPCTKVPRVRFGPRRYMRVKFVGSRLCFSATSVIPRLLTFFSRLDRLLLGDSGFSSPTPLFPSHQNPKLHLTYCDLV